MFANLTSVVCIFQIVLLITLTAHNVFKRRRLIVAICFHKGWIASARGLAPMSREPAFGGGDGAIVYLLPERGETLNPAPQRHAA